MKKIKKIKQNPVIAPLDKKARFRVTPNAIVSLIMTLILGTILFRMSPSFFENILLGIHNLSEKMSGLSYIGDAATLFGDLDEYAGWFVFLVVIMIVITVLLGLVKKSSYGGGRRRRR